MDISKINISKINNTVVSPFRADTTVVKKQDDNKEKNKDIATKFLYGAGVISAGVLAVSLAARAGVFRKSRVNLTKDTMEDFLKFNSKPTETKVTSTFDPAEALAKTTNFDPRDFRSIVDYSRYDRFNAKSAQGDFFKEVSSTIDNASYEEQYEEFGYLLDFIKSKDPSELNAKINLNLENYKLDNKMRISQKMFSFSNEHPEYDNFFSHVINIADKYLIDYSRYQKNVTDGQKSAFFTNTVNKIAKLSGGEQVGQFRNYLEFLKILPFEDVQNQVLFRMGKFGENNLSFAQMSIDFAKDNPKLSDTLVSNLISYEPDEAFAKELAYSTHFTKTDSLASRYENHMDNIIKIRNMLTEAGIKCDRKTQLKNRQDWININFPTSNSYTLGFHYSERMPELRKAAFEYDIMNGITKEDADGLIEKLSADHSIARKSPDEILKNLKDISIPQDRAKQILDGVLNESNNMKNYVSSINFQWIPKENYDASMENISKAVSGMQSKIDALLAELEAGGVSKEQTNLIYKQLTSIHDLTNTQKMYGMTKEEMIAKIEAAII